jgi:hypothetical protein
VRSGRCRGISLATRLVCSIPIPAKAKPFQEPPAPQGQVSLDPCRFEPDSTRPNLIENIQHKRQEPQPRTCEKDLAV